jgi:hypothetical protein
MAEQVESQPLAGSRFLPWLLVALVIVFVAAIWLRLLQIPLERDEGEYAYAAYAAIMAIFGQSVWGIHMGFLLVNARRIEGLRLGFAQCRPR